MSHLISIELDSDDAKLLYEKLDKRKNLPMPEYYLRVALERAIEIDDAEDE